VTAVRVDGTDHNTIETSPVYWQAIQAFLSAPVRPLAAPEPRSPDTAAEK
jgi:hypothetical protein